LSTCIGVKRKDQTREKQKKRRRKEAPHDPKEIKNSKNALGGRLLPWEYDKKLIEAGRGVEVSKDGRTLNGRRRKGVGGG